MQAVSDHRGRNTGHSAAWLYKVLLTILLFVSVAKSYGQDSIPGPPDPPRLVNDFAGLLTAGQNEQLESKLVAFNDSTGVQIAVVIVNSLAGYDKADYAQRLGQKWGVGGVKFDNGFVMLLKPKTDSEPGQVFIATGYGVEKFVTDANASDIVNLKMIPYFKANDYYSGIDAGVDELIGFVKGEYKSDTYGKSQSSPYATLIIIILIVILVIWISRNNNNHRTITRSGTSGGPVFFPWIGGGGSSSGSGGWGGFGGGGGGGFGGFGGGSFGGGGAGGSW